MPFRHQVGERGLRSHDTFKMPKKCVHHVGHLKQAFKPRLSLQPALPRNGLCFNKLVFSAHVSLPAPRLCPVPDTLWYLCSRDLTNELNTRGASQGITVAPCFLHWHCTQAWPSSPGSREVLWQCSDDSFPRKILFHTGTKRPAVVSTMARQTLHLHGLIAVPTALCGASLGCDSSPTKSPNAAA